MLSLLAGVGLLLLAGLICLVLRKNSRMVSYVGPGAAVMAAALGIVPSLRVIFSANVQAIHRAWSLPYGSVALELDALSGWFLVPILIIGALAAVYGAKYLESSAGDRSLGAAWFFYDVLMASMIVLVLARNGVLFLVAWEVMSLASFFLVMFEDDRPDVRQAGWTYLVATHVGTAFLLAMFVLAGHGSGDLDFARFGETAPTHAGVLFVLAVIGFGTKAGFLPMHIWLPEAHPAAPSHVSAVMSGVMIKMGIYGLLRTLTFLGPPSSWWAWVLIVVGIASAVLGIMFALAQHDLKRLLAYSSVENMGIIAVAIGLGVMGAAKGSAALAVLGFGGALLHVLNHSLFKSLLFLGAGAVLHGTGTGRLDSLGGLFKRMPWTGSAFLVGSAAICGLPPLNGFCGELLIYLAALRHESTAGMAAATAGLCVAAALALAGGLAVAAFVKAFAGCFLGEPRSQHAAHAHDPHWAMRAPLLVLAAGCVLAALLSPVLAAGFGPMVRELSGYDASVLQPQLAWASSMLSRVVLVGLGLAATAGLLAVLRARLLSGRRVEQSVTWDCGYAQPTPRMEYTPSSFVQPLTAMFAPVLRTQVSLNKPVGCFPADASLGTSTPDVFVQGAFRPGLSFVCRMLARLRWLQHGHVQAYVSYIGLALLAVLVWKLW
jgi:formate hydrogenlyase subunit 3/multisubunit Na+/H+ antiporter MnhD subunit